MKLNDIEIGAAVKVRVGSSIRPATVAMIDIAIGKVGVRYTDITTADLATIPTTRRAGLLAATVRPNAITTT